LEVLSHPQSDRRIRSVGILAGGFNPPTRAHLALVEAAAASVDVVLCVVPRIYPHKTYHGATLEQRIALLHQAAGSPPRFGVAIAEKGLFADIAEECREALGAHSEPGLEVQFVCGRDAAERIVTWDYGAPGTIERMMERFGLLVASRGGPWTAPETLAHRVAPLELPGSFDEVSSSEVRARIEQGKDWHHLVPPEIVAEVEAIFRRK